MAKNSLIRAIPIEIILRKNQALINRNVDLIPHDIPSLQALQINAKVSEYSRLLNEAVQLTIDIQTDR